ncbi:MAG: hypothetical protein OWQ51_03220 [Pyrobaculum arsenaticum]|uniref:Uncharacterized protein n=2 Tax=Pyrobaculum arsenaticum TaxID=121277 RepID=A4WKV2_PYRAR|nr:hypothetical protein [Pyrobaculum arsenaticum]ABP51019.1 hypothetical protein Pars_1462 [Pyrobaculum arsenaticum DSM 13514]MCY0889983.1 hypothetical protein [Pyrobaculum arsenaticum]NYR15256.1 hypothetical protein [Pyrobaculum arsenaticum]
MRHILAIMAITAVALAVVYVSEGGDVVYYSTLGGFGALNGLGQRLWHVDAPGALIATDPMGSCLAVAHPLGNATSWLGTRVALYVRGAALWSAVLKLNASAIATDCNRIAVGTMDGRIVELQNGRVASEKTVGVPVISLVYDGGALRYGVWRPGYVEHPLRCGYTVALAKRDKPYVVVDGREYVGFGELLSLSPPAAVSQNCVLTFAAEGAVYWGSAAIPVKEPVYAVAISGDGNVLAVGFADRVELYRGGQLAASIQANMPRSLALDFRGFTLAVQDDSGVQVYSFTQREVEVVGCPYGVIKAGVATYNVTGRAVVYVPRGAELTPLRINFTDGVCAPAGFDGRVVSYQRLYRVEVTPPAKGPELAAGPTAYAAPLEAEVRAKTGVLKAYLAGWLVGGRRMPPVPVLTVDVRNATAVAPLYRLDVAAELVEGGVKRVLKGVAAYDSKGAPMAPVEDYVYPGLPAYVETYYDEYYLLRAEAYTRSTFNATELWLKPGQTAVIYADEVVDFGNSTRLVFTGWSDGSKELRRAVGPGTYTARYKVQYLVTFNAPNYTAAVWADAGAKPPAPKPPEKLYDDGSTRIWFNGWQLPERVDGPLNVTANTAREYRVVLKYPWGQEERWLPHGYALLPPDRNRYNVFWRFSHWAPSDVVAGPGVYEAVYQLDAFAVAAIASVVIITAAVALWLKRR